MFGEPALCEGRGEIITPITGLPKFYITVAIGSGRLPTADVFKAYDAMNCKPTDGTAKFMAALGSGDTKALISAMSNGFTDVCAKLCPEATEMRQRIKSCRAETALLSGSGPAVYGVFLKKEQAVEAARNMRARGFFAVDCETL